MTHVDSIIGKLRIKSTKDTFSLADTLTKRFKSDTEKVRAIYFWMTQNIAYDGKALRKGCPVPFEGNLENYLDNRVIHTLKTKKGVCEDYALVFACLCRRAGIKCIKVTGYALTTKPARIFQMFKKFTSEHAWNAVEIEGKWYLIDVTWASGFTNAGVTKFTRRLNDFYYLTDPKLFILDHYPDDAKWQLMNPPLDWKNFFANARYRKKDK